MEKYIVQVFYCDKGKPKEEEQCVEVEVEAETSTDAFNIVYCDKNYGEKYHTSKFEYVVWKPRLKSELKSATKKAKKNA